MDDGLHPYNIRSNDDILFFGQQKGDDGQQD